MGLVLKRTAFHGDAAPFIMELPAYRLPAPRNVARQLWDKASDFLKRAFTVIFLATMVVWFLQHFTFTLSPAPDMAHSMLGVIAGAIAPVFTPAGFGHGGGVHRGAHRRHGQGERGQHPGACSPAWTPTARRW